MPPKSNKQDSEEAGGNGKNSPNGATGGAANTINRRNWKQSYEALLAYKELHGDCLVPSQYDEDSALGHWVRKQRRNENEGKLSDEKRRMLDDIGFVWKLRTIDFPAGRGGHEDREIVKKRSWQDNYKALLDFKKEKGHVKVPRRYKYDHELGAWVFTQKLNPDKLTRRQKKLLSDIGFDFEVKAERLERLWNEKFEALKAYKDETGDTQVPYHYEEVPGLGPWVSDQRQKMLDGTLSKKRATALESIEFELDVDDSASDPILSQPSPNTPNEYLVGNDELTPLTKRPRISNKKKFLVQFNALVEFQRKYGHTQPPRKRFQALAYWVQRQRLLYSQNNLKSERKAMLNSIGFDWDAGGNNAVQHHFDEMVDRLLDFQSEHGHVDPPKDYRAGGLGGWVDSMKTTGKDGAMDPHNAERLLRIGFTWEEDRTTWNMKFHKVNKIVEECRRTPSKPLELPEELRNWVKVQVLLIEYDLLPPKRMARFQSMGVVMTDSEIALADNIGDEKLQLKIETTPDESRWNGLCLKNAARCWNPHGPTTEIVGSEDTDTSKAKRKKPTMGDLQSLEEGQLVKKMRTNQQSLPTYHVAENVSI